MHLITMVYILQCTLRYYISKILYFFDIPKLQNSKKWCDFYKTTFSRKLNLYKRWVRIQIRSLRIYPRVLYYLHSAPITCLIFWTLGSNIALLRSSLASCILNTSSEGSNEGDSNICTWHISWNQIRSMDTGICYSNINITRLNHHTGTHGNVSKISHKLWGTIFRISRI